MLNERHALAVAPRAGAWIETLLGGPQAGLALSLPARERGLKPVEVVVRHTR